MAFESLLLSLNFESFVTDREVPSEFAHSLISVRTWFVFL